MELQFKVIKDSVTLSNYLENFQKLVGVALRLYFEENKVTGCFDNTGKLVGVRLLLIKHNALIMLYYVFSKKIPATLTTKGPYRIIRHPLYTAYTIGWIGGIIATGYYWLFLTIIPLLIYYYKAAKQEKELFLQSPLQKQCETYMNETGRFLPKI